MSDSGLQHAWSRSDTIDDGLPWLHAGSRLELLLNVRHREVAPQAVDVKSSSYCHGLEEQICVQCLNEKAGCPVSVQGIASIVAFSGATIEED